MDYFVIGEGAVVKIIREFLDENRFASAISRQLTKTISHACHTQSDIALYGFFASVLILIVISIKKTGWKGFSYKKMMVASAVMTLSFGLGSQILSSDPIGQHCKTKAGAQLT